MGTAAYGSQAQFAPAYDIDDWREHARCKGVSLDVFFPSALGPAMYDQARTYCASCPVRLDCLDDALAHGYAWREDGFRGGKTPRERAELRGVRMRLVHRRCRRCRTSYLGPAARETLYCSDDCRNEVRAERARRARGSA